MDFSDNIDVFAIDYCIKLKSEMDLSKTIFVLELGLFPLCKNNRFLTSNEKNNKNL